MATKAQRKAQRAKRQEKKRQKAKLREKKRSNETPVARLQSRMAKQTSRAWDGECVEDRAVFDNKALQSLSPELAAQAQLVRETLAAVCGSPSQSSLEPLATIPRSSPFAAWRLFLRGLTAWQNGDPETAGRSWERLDRERRPGRIATTMMLARRDNLESLSRNASNSLNSNDDDVKDCWTTSLDPELVYHAKLLRRVHVDRIAIRAARSATRIPEEVEEATLGPRRIAWLREFTKEHQATEPDLVQALHEVALHRAFCGPYIDLFMDAVRYFVGPRHDRQNNLLTYFHESMVKGDKAEQQAERAWERYLTVDLPKNKEISPELRAALVSQLHLNEAMFEMARRESMRSYSFLYNEPADSRLIEGHLKSSIEAYPKNRAAYEANITWIESQFYGRLKKAERDKLDAAAARVRRRWTKALPDDIEPRVALVDYLLENDKSDEAKTHVDFLAGVRRDDPLARATPWKWSLLEAMRLCRRKAWASAAPDRLSEAKEKWPAWLPQSWLPYLHAAYHLRCGDHDRFQAQWLEARSSGSIPADSLQDACMMLGAAQRMRVPSPDLKPLRQPIESALENLSTLDEDDLLSTASFFWDLHRVNLLYPAYRMHGSKFIRELLARFAKRPQTVLGDLDNPRIQSALFLMSEQGHFAVGYDVSMPEWLGKINATSHVTLVATEASAVLYSSWTREATRHPHVVPGLRRAVSQADAYYRYWFSKLADDVEEAIADSKSSYGGFARFADLFRQFAEEEDDDGDDECDCDVCRAARGEI